MQLALLDGERVEAFRGGKANCPICGADMIAKCGPRTIHHWAHKGRRNCDPWWENETEWHRSWKECFPICCREISHIAPDGEVHRADIRTPSGIYIEVQHSGMTDAERISREAFYKNLVWIIDGRPFQRNFQLCHILPDPLSAVAADLVWFPARLGYNGANEGIFWRRSENPNVIPGTGGMVEIHPIREIESEIRASFRGHHQYTWAHPRNTWLEATCPVYLDFGTDLLVRLERYANTNLRCARLIAKSKFLQAAMVEAHAADIVP